MNVLFPKELNIDWKEYIQEMSSIPVLKPFSPVVLDFLQDLSRVLMKDTVMRQYPDMVALGYWLRKARIYEMRKEFYKQNENKVIKARGAVLHFAPSNVDTIFIYSWVVSLLSGNTNIIRVSRRENVQLERLIDLLVHLLDQGDYEAIKKRTCICRYEHDVNVTAFLSQYCHCRVIWGGDDTVRTIRSIPLAPLATELVFANRFSSAVLSAESVLHHSEEQLGKLAHNFYNDAFWFDQLACSSPRLVAWVGKDRDILEAKDRFWKALLHEVHVQGYAISPASKMLRTSTAYFFAATDAIEKLETPLSSEIMRLHTSDLSATIRSRHCGMGMFIETDLAHLDELIPYIRDEDQTITHHGFEKEELVQMIEKLNGRGVDRLVPIGQALQFNHVWDGYNMFMYFTREIDISI
ncbi:acyl-CoA reductase [Halalkalibacter hemicellulosilyticus]|uniref:Coenzyme F390 synthetase n=1 Tax=Halalkalibacter hemicellulosilyticusJCM 9152 TaxID=1236971 RepID=W4QJ75_9BACI|nr:acyl-CoA reductase [Halalkalibacter hemicellulosilyticus]GAE32146.1 coenzyme F390 synthetase [Halalkalibacter hemicellulosilyticusJCM 9152]